MAFYFYLVIEIVRTSLLRFFARSHSFAILREFFQWMDSVMVTFGPGLNGRQVHLCAIEKIVCNFSGKVRANIRFTLISSKYNSLPMIRQSVLMYKDDQSIFRIRNHVTKIAYSLMGLVMSCIERCRKSKKAKRLEIFWRIERDLCASCAAANAEANSSVLLFNKTNYVIPFCRFGVR